MFQGVEGYLSESLFFRLEGHFSSHCQVYERSIIVGRTLEKHVSSYTHT